MKTYNHGLYTVHEYTADEQIKAPPLPMIGRHTDIIVSERGLYQSDGYYITGGGLDTESTTISHTIQEGKNKDGSLKYKTVIDSCFVWVYQIAINNDIYLLRTIAQFTAFVENLVEKLKSIEPIESRRYDSDKKRIEKIWIWPKFVLWVANLSHEFSFIKNVLANMPITKFFATDDREILLVEIDSVLQFRECLGLFGHSLADIAKHHTTTKKAVGELDYNLIRHSNTPIDYEKELNYICNDVAILSELHHKAINKLGIQKRYTIETKQGSKDIAGVVFPFTSTGYIRNELKEEIAKDEDITYIVQNYKANMKKMRMKPKYFDNIGYLKNEHGQMIHSKWQWNICRNYSYAGGLCGSNPHKVCKVLHDVYCFDLVSDYPAQLNHELYPAGKINYIKAPSERDILRRQEHKQPYFLYMLIDIQAKTPHTVFSKHKVIHDKDSVLISPINGKLVKGEGIRVCWNDVDIAAYKMAYKITVHKIFCMWYFDRYEKAPAYLLNTLNHRYLQKWQLKKEGFEDTQEYNDSKRFVNGCYGVLATREHVIELIFSGGQLGIGSVKTFDQIRQEFWLNPYIAFWCTSYARKVLISFITKYPDSIIQYDTDSLYCTYDKALFDDIAAYNELIKKKNAELFTNPAFSDLGTLEQKAKYDTFIACGSKKYITVKDNKIKCTVAGLPKSTLEEMEKGGYTLNDLIKIVSSLHTNVYIISNMFCHKLASVYEDTNDTTEIKVTDYTGKEYIQDVTSYHALIPIDFTLAVSKDFMDK